MLRLHGFSTSNYYNVPKLAMLEKGIEFEEVLVYTGAGSAYRPDYLEMSPLGKVPCLQTDEGFISESRCIVEYLEDAYPDVPLFPKSPFQRAKLRELSQIIDLYLELAARRMLPATLMGVDAPEVVKNEVRETILRGITALRSLASFDGFLLGGAFSAVDVSAVLHFPVVSLVATAQFGKDPLADVPRLEAYMERLSERPTLQRVRADAANDGPAFFAHLKKLYGLASNPLE